ncbi:plakophilin-1 isoform X1 [Scophthalmus maximus]|uniref:plakophilin-1 isoform X1 n=1 Tax=Scophthalmus maximus TaxID=52904 RepID=UPI0015E0F290|nr:plakophilin-1 isoform X1 [Scophthalmus maximus]
MTSLDPLKSVISLGNVDDTSLALPSGNQSRSGHQRVLEQVQTMRRSRSRHSSSGRSASSGGRSASTSMSPTSPLYDPVFLEPFKSQSDAANGSVFVGNGVSKTLNAEKSVKRQVVINCKESAVERNPAAAAYHNGRSYTVTAGQTKTSRSEPDLAWQRSPSKRSVPLRGFVSGKGTNRAERTTSQIITSTWKTLPNRGQESQTDGAFKALSKLSVAEGTSKNKVHSGTNGHSGVADITMKEAVEYLSNSGDTFQHCGASYIQHNTFIDDKAKEEVLKLNGIPPLVALLRSPKSQVCQTASAALRNLSFKSNSTKEAIHRRGGITEAVALLRDTDSVELQKQLTGLLWNLSSANELKPDLLKSALPVLMERVILPYTTGPDRTDSNSQDPEILFHATGCLRNLSSANQNNRQVMRKCRGLVDSLVSYVTDCVEAGRPDDKSVENCVCVLHNLTFQLEAEAPTLFSRITALARTVDRSQSHDDVGPISCFSPQSKSAEHEDHFDYPVVEDPQPSGAGWLFHSKTLESYLNLLASSQRDDTLEACFGTLQNLTGHGGVVSRVMSQTIVHKLNGLQVITPHLKSNKIVLQRNAVALVGNLTKNPGLHSPIARKALPELVNIITAGSGVGYECDDTLSMACRTANSLFVKEPEAGKRLLNITLMNALKNLSQSDNRPKSRKEASLLLCSLWSDKDLQSFMKKVCWIKFKQILASFGTSLVGTSRKICASGLGKLISTFPIQSHVIGVVLNNLL